MGVEHVRQTRSGYFHVAVESNQDGVGVTMMSREEYDSAPSDGRHPCPDCGNTRTRPHPGCGCPLETLRNGFSFTRHINKFHHVCEVNHAAK